MFGQTNMSKTPWPQPLFFTRQMEGTWEELCNWAWKAWFYLWQKQLHRLDGMGKDGYGFIGPWAMPFSNFWRKSRDDLIKSHPLGLNYHYSFKREPDFKGLTVLGWGFCRSSAPYEYWKFSKLPSVCYAMVTPINHRLGSVAIYHFLCITPTLADKGL